MTIPPSTLLDDRRSAPNRSFRRTAAAVALFVLSVIPSLVVAAEKTPVTLAVDELFEWTGADTPGCAVAAAHDGKPLLRTGYGVADIESGKAITPATLLDAGSLTKQVVAAAILLLVEEEKIALDDEVRKHIPELARFSKPLTVNHLLTHTGGVRDWLPLANLSREPAAPLDLILRQRGLEFEPGAEWSYSNSGYVLMKELVARLTGKPFSEFVAQRIFARLGMSSTRYSENLDANPAGLALAYSPQRSGGWQQDMLDATERGGGALLSTADDLLKWNEALRTGKLGPFVTSEIHQPAKLTNGRELGYARGVFLDHVDGDPKKGRVVWHTGSAAGYKSMLARYPDQDLSVAILCNDGGRADRMRVARTIHDTIAVDAKVQVDPAEHSATAPYSSSQPEISEKRDLQAYAGTFFASESDPPLQFMVRGDSLRLFGAPPLVATGSASFRPQEASLSFRSQDAFELHFESPNEVVYRSMEGSKTPYRRGQPQTLGPEQLAAFADTYESEELDARLVVQLDEPKGLRIQLNDSPPFAFKAVDEDTFAFRAIRVRFQRETKGGKEGAVTGLVFSNPVLRGVEFDALATERK